MNYLAMGGPTVAKPEYSDRYILSLKFSDREYDEAMDRPISTLASFPSKSFNYITLIMLKINH